MKKHGHHGQEIKAPRDQHKILLVPILIAKLQVVELITCQVLAQKIKLYVDPA